jgi:hypothetical protein
MDNKKFEQLIDLIINENEEQARSLFHDIVVEKSREIYESMMADEMEESMEVGGQVGDLLDEIGAEESGVVEGEGDDDEEGFDFEDEDEEDDEIIDIEGNGSDGTDGEEIEDRVADLEDKLDQLMAEFEDIMSDEDSGDMGEEDFSGEEGDMEDFGDEDEAAMMEAVQLKNVPGLYGSRIGGDNGAQSKSPSLVNSGQAGMDSKPVQFAGGAESVPTSPKGPSNAYAKGETQVKGAGSFKNAPAQNNFKEKGEATPKPVTKDEAGAVKSPVAESRRATKRIVR